MFIICMFIKVAGIYTCAHFFSAIGGASAMENDFNSAYDSLSMDNSQSQHSHLQQSQHGTNGGGYYPPQHEHNSMNDSGKFMFSCWYIYGNEHIWIVEVCSIDCKCNISIYILSIYILYREWRSRWFVVITFKCTLYIYVLYNVIYEFKHK